jgi:hypothetical protein
MVAVATQCSDGPEVLEIRNTNASLRDLMRAAYDDAVREIESGRPVKQLTNLFYTVIGNSVFDACCTALEDYRMSVALRGHAKPATLEELKRVGAANQEGFHPRLHVVSAPMGAGKTTFSQAIMMALVRLSEKDPSLPPGCVFVVEQIRKAEEMFVELQKLLPGKVAVWTADHDTDRKNWTRLPNPVARFRVDDLKKYPIAIVTHAFFRGRRGHKSREIERLGAVTSRALTIIDEKPSDVTVYDVELSAAIRARELAQMDEEHRAVVLPKIDALVSFMTPKALGRGASIEKPNDDTKAWRSTEDLSWFTSDEAKRYAIKAASSDVQAVFGFAKSMAEGYAFIARHHQGEKGTHFIGYETKLTIVPGMVLLDATADIDGVAQIAPWRSRIEVPKARYDNLTIVHVEPWTRKRLSTFLRYLPNRREYVRWMKEVVKAHMEPGQRGLIVCKKRLFDDRNVPDWLPDDPRFEQPESYVTSYGWNIDGRNVAATYWGGYGIGANDWRDAEIIFLFDEFHPPSRAVIATIQGTRMHKACEGVLGSLHSLNGATPEIEWIREGHLLRWTKQMALRGRGRMFDEHGVCGHQKLVVSGNFERLITHADKLFPGAEIVKVREESDVTQYTRPTALLELMSEPGLPDVVPTNWIGERMRVAWREVSSGLLRHPSVRRGLANLGWEYVAKPGRGNVAYFRRRPDSLVLRAAPAL